MASTPEGKVKDKIKAILKAAPECYYHMPVQNGMGKPTLDFIGCSKGRYFAVEAKAKGKSPTERQQDTICEMWTAGGMVFVICGVDDDRLKYLETWLWMPSKSIQ